MRAITEGMVTLCTKTGRLGEGFFGTIPVQRRTQGLFQVLSEDRCLGKDPAEFDRPTFRLRQAGHFLVEFSKLQCLVRGIEVRMVSGLFPAGTPNCLEMIPALVEGNHLLGQDRNRGDLGIIGRNSIQIIALELLDRAIKAGVMRIGPSIAHPLQGIPHGALIIETESSKRGSRGTAVLTMMTVQVDLAWQVPHRAGDAQTLISRNTIISNGKMDVAQTMSTRPFHLRAGPIDRNHRPDAQLLQGSKPRVSLGTTPAENLLVHPVHIVESGKFAR